MRLTVVEWWPENYMAMFHAGMADFALGHDLLAEQRLRRFLAMYSPSDVWHDRAEQARSGDIAGTPRRSSSATRNFLRVAMCGNGRRHAENSRS